MLTAVYSGGHFTSIIHIIRLVYVKNSRYTCSRPKPSAGDPPIERFRARLQNVLQLPDVSIGLGAPRDQTKGVWIRPTLQFLSWPPSCGFRSRGFTSGPGCGVPTPFRPIAPVRSWCSIGRRSRSGSSAHSGAILSCWQEAEVVERYSKRRDPASHAGQLPCARTPSDFTRELIPPQMPRNSFDLRYEHRCT